MGGEGVVLFNTLSKTTTIRKEGYVKGPEGILIGALKLTAAIWGGELSAIEKGEIYQVEKGPYPWK